MHCRSAEKYPMTAEKTSGYVGRCPKLDIQTAVRTGNIFRYLRPCCSKNVIIFLFLITLISMIIIHEISTLSELCSSLIYFA